MSEYGSQAFARLLAGDAGAISETISFARPRRATGDATPSGPTGWARHAKRLLDIVLALSVLLVWAVPMMAIALLVKLDTPGPILFRQRRLGLHGRPFALLKFRTMYDHDHSPFECRQATEHDPRITRLGHLLRCTSLDELPQMFNVLRGEMSIVGPRPHAPGTRAGGRLFEEVCHRYADRHRVRPGVTGLAQVRGWRGQTDTEDKLCHRIECDLEYIATWSLRLDLLIVWQTIFAVLRMRNAF
jgi:lipopolysaccharide/colanic/teichoic acid biosynthesis glycosyltransferase